MSQGTRNQRRRNILRPRRGAEVVELALLMLPLLWLTFGAVDYGYYFYLEHNCQAAAREGARAGIPYWATNADVDAAAKKIMTNAGFKNQDKYKVEIAEPVDSLEPGDDVTVTVSMNYKAMGVPPARVQKTTVKGVATMRKE